MGREAGTWASRASSALMCCWYPPIGRFRGGVLGLGGPAAGSSTATSSDMPGPMPIGTVTTRTSLLPGNRHPKSPPPRTLGGMITRKYSVATCSGRRGDASCLRFPATASRGVVAGEPAAPAERPASAEPDGVSAGRRLAGPAAAALSLRGLRSR